MSGLVELIGELGRRHADLSLESVREWKLGAPRRRAIGCLPVFAPREVLWAAGALPVFVRGAGDQIEIVRGDAYYQSYICHLPRSVLELGLGGWLDTLDGMIFPNTCDVIRNLCGVWRSELPTKFVRFLDPPQSGDQEAGARWWRGELERLYVDLCALTGRAPRDEALALAICEYGESRRALRDLAGARAAEPWNVPADEAYLLRRAGDTLPPLEHANLVDRYLAETRERGGRREDRIRVVLAGAFCEQPPVALLRAVERAGCYIVEDDLVLSGQDVEIELVIAEAGASLDLLARAYVADGVACAVRFDPQREAGRALVRKVRALGADGVVFAAPSFCDPALLDQPRLAAALDEAHIPYTAFKYAENTGQFQGIREQAGTFADSVRLWGTA